MTGPPSARVVGPTCEELIHALDDDVRIVFDLDGTLYDTRDFERPALAAVANWLRDKSGLPLVGLTQRLWTRRESDRHRLGLFSDLLVEFGLPASWSGECLRQFHEHPAQELSVAHSLRDCLARESFRP